jgi:Putative phage abortive infection protein
MLAPFSATSSICQYLAPNTAYPELVGGLPFLLLDFREQGRPFDKLRVSGEGWRQICLTLCVVRKGLSFSRCHSDIHLMSEEEPDRAIENIPKWIWLLALGVFLVLVGIALEGWLSSPNAETMGQWGDFFGGTLNPILTFLTVAGLLYTIILQRSELRLSREELILTRKELKSSAEALRDQNDSMKQQRFESTLFSMIGVLNQIIDQMDLGEPCGENRVGETVYKTRHGRDCFSVLESGLRDIYERRSWNDEPYWKEKVSVKANGEWDVIVDYPHDGERIKNSYDHLYNLNSADLGHYFRVLYQVFSFIRDSDYSNPIYQKIVRAQLSNQELFILYYNCASPIGEKFRDIAVEFALFDNMETKRLIRANHINLLPREAFGNNPMILPDE